MKRKIIFSILIILGLFVITGCSNDKRPKIKATDITVYKGVNFNPKNYVEVEKNAKLEVISNNVNDHKSGKYSVTYKATLDGKSTKKTINVTVSELNQDILEDEIGKILKKNSLSNYTYKKNIGDGFNIESSKYLNKKVSENQNIRMFNRIPIISAIDTKNYNLSDGNNVYRINTLSFCFEFTDNNSNLNDRWNLYSINQTFEITNGTSTITAEGNSLLSGSEDSEYDKMEYKSIFSYDMKISNLEKLKEIIDSNNVTIKINVTDGYNSPNSSLPPETITPHTLEYQLAQDDINNLKNTLSLIHATKKVIG